MDTSTPTKIDPKDFTPAPREVIKINPKDFITGKGEAALIGVGAKEVGKRVGRALSTPETALRTIPPLALQTAGAVGGGYLGGEPGAAAGGAIASVASDMWQRFLNHMYGVPNEPLSLKREAGSAAVGGLLTEAPKAAGAVTGLNAAEKVATGAAAKAGEAQTEAKAALTAEQTRVAGVKAEAKPQMAREAMGKVAADSEKIQANIDANKAKLREHIGKQLEAKRGETATQVGTQATQQMIGKTPQQLAQQEATSGPAFARIRAEAQAPVFEGARAYHDEVGKLYEPYIGPHQNEQLSFDQLKQLQTTMEGIRNRVSERGQTITNTDLNRIMGGFEDAQPDVQIDELLRKSGWSVKHIKDASVGEKQLAIKMNLREGVLKPEDVQVKMPTIGELWGMRGRASRVLATSNNPSDRLAAHEITDALTELMPDIPDKVRQQYAAERSQFPPAVMRQVAQARNPGEVGAAIFGSPTSPEPAQVALNLIRRAKTPEAQEGLRTAFADNWLSKPHNPDDIGRYNPAVIKGLFGKDSDAVFKILGTEGSIKSASWQKLIASSPQAKASFDAAYEEAIRSQRGKMLQQAISEGEQALRAQPDKYGAALKALKEAKDPANKLQVLEQALAKLPDPKDAAVEALGKRGVVPDSRLERAVLMGLGFRAMYAAAGSGGALMKHPELALGLGGLIGGRAVVRLALSQPTIARAFVNTLDLSANPANAASMGKIIGQMTSAAALQYVKENPDLGVGESALQQR